MKKPKPWKRAEYLAQQCRNGKILCCFNQQSEDRGNEVVYFLEPGGAPVGRKTVDNALKHNLIKPGNDGLFGSEFSQTWTAS